jgi:hypothetical protein
LELGHFESPKGRGNSGETRGIDFLLTIGTSLAYHR